MYGQTSDKLAFKKGSDLGRNSKEILLFGHQGTHKMMKLVSNIN